MYHVYLMIRLNEITIHLLSANDNMNHLRSSSLRQSSNDYRLIERCSGREIPNKSTYTHTKLIQGPALSRRQMSLHLHQGISCITIHHHRGYTLLPNARFHLSQEGRARSARHW